jgi:hypothetical protein
MSSVSVVINYCSNENIFLRAVLTECQKFSNDIVVAYGSHLYDGTKEDADHILQYTKEFPDINFVEYNVDVSLENKDRAGVNNRPTAYWHNLARWTGIQSTKNKGWVFLIDCDEIPEGDRLSLFLKSVLLDETKCYKFANYWYFKDTTNQATTFEDSVLCIHAKYTTRETIFGDWERDHTANSSGLQLQRMVMSDRPLFHHYSWVRSKENLIHKITSWGHSNDIFKNANVDSLINFIYGDDNVNDIVHGYNYIKVEPKFGIIV